MTRVKVLASLIPSKEEKSENTTEKENRGCKRRLIGLLAAHSAQSIGLERRCDRTIRSEKERRSMSTTKRNGGSGGEGGEGGVKMASTGYSHTHTHTHLPLIPLLSSFSFCVCLHIATLSKCLYAMPLASRSVRQAARVRRGAT